MTKRTRRPNVSKGTLVPLGNGFSLAVGKHPEKTDDIDIGPNNKNGLSVNHGEIIQKKGDSVRIFSAEPILGGVSPSQLLYGGMNPNKVFAMQEQYKRANRIADDGSHYQNGGEDIIPDKYDKPLKFSEIPHSRKINVIDNYSKSFDYIVQGDKIYYMKKGLKDNWVDISDNDVARNNLFNFIHDRYNFKGYDDSEKDIYNKLKEGSYKYSDRNKIINQNTINDKIEENNIIESADTTNKKLNLNDIRLSGGVVPYADTINYSNTINKINNIGRKIESKAKGFIDTLISYGNRGIQKYLHKDKAKPSLNVNEVNNENSEYNIIPQSATGDTVSVKSIIPGRYILPESLDISDFTFGIRNRGDNKPLNSNVAPITSLKPFSSYESFGFDKLSDKEKQKLENANFMGIDEKGNFKIGHYSLFKPGDTLTKVTGNKVYKFNHLDNGNYKTRPAKGNAPYYYATALMETDDGKQKDGDIQLLLYKDDVKGEKYGSVVGGRYIIKVGNEIRLVSGSLKNIEEQFENMKKRHGTDYGIFYTLDNGSFSKALRVKHNNFTSKDLSNYDLDNRGGGGHFAYITGTNKYQSDTISTPNIRTINSDSYKQGHSLINDKKGIVLHHTAFSPMDSIGVRKHFQNPKSEASSHVVIFENGDRKVYGKPDDVTFHAGHSRYNNKFDVNDFMLGAEFNGNTLNTPLTDDQINSFVEYATPIIRKYNISLENITTHEQVRQAYNEYVTNNRVRDDKGKIRKKDEPKYDITYEQYKRIIDALKNRLYYKKAFKYGGIYIKPSKRGTFTAAAKKHGMSVQGFANKVLANKGSYSSAMVKKANFARNASKWHHHILGGEDSLMRTDSKGNLIDSIEPSIITAKLPAKFNGSQVAAAKYAEGYKFGKKVAQQRDNITKQTVDKILPINSNKDLDNNVLGYTPIIGSILQGAQGVKDIYKGNYLKGAIGLGLLTVPNIIKKPLKQGYRIARLIKNGGYNKFKYTIPTKLYKELNQFNIDDIRKSVIDYQQFRDLERGAIDINPYNEAKTIKVRPASRAEIKINNKGKTETNVGLIKVDAINTGNEIIFYPNAINKGNIGHELRHSIMRDLTSFYNEDYLVRPGYQNFDFLDNTIIGQNPTPIGTKILSKNKHNWYKQVDEFDAELENLRQTFAPNTTYKELLKDKGKPNSRYDKFIEYLKPRFNITEDEADIMMKELYDAGFKFGGQTKINSLGERPNAKLEKEMNKRRKGLYGLEYTPYYTKRGNLIEESENLGNDFQSAFDGSDFSTLSDVNKSNRADVLADTGVISSNPVKPINPVKPVKQSTTFWDKTKNFMSSANGRDLIGTVINAAGSLIAAGINANAIKNLKFTPRKAVYLNPVKLKTKINIAPQIAKMRETVASLTNAARRTSASSRNAYQKIANARFRGLQAYSDLLGRKENEETTLINKDRLNQQQVAHNNAKIAMEVINTNIAGKDNLNNTQRMLGAQNGVSLVNNLAGIVAGPQGLLARREARIRDANNLSIATLPYLKEFNTLSKDEFVKKHGRAVWNAIANGRPLVG